MIEIGKPTLQWFHPVLCSFMVKVFATRLQLQETKKAQYLVSVAECFSMQSCLKELLCVCSAMHPSFHRLKQFIPFLPSLSFPSLWGLLRLLEGITSDVKENQVSPHSFQTHLKKLLVEVASVPSDHSLLPVLASFVSPL